MSQALESDGVQIAEKSVLVRKLRAVGVRAAAVVHEVIRAAGKRP